MATSIAPRRRRQPACEGCRSQKVKCDAEPPGACARCRRMDLKCVITPNTGARKTKTQLQRELESLKTRDSATGSHNVVLPNPGPVLADSAAASVPIETFIAAPGLASSATARDVPMTFPSATISESTGRQFPPLFADDQSNPQMLDDQVISTRKIRDCFTLFFEFYAPYLPILDATTTPNDYFRQSPFLFWTIIYLGSRGYVKDPTLVGCLAPKINSMALSALGSRADAMQTIEGNLLLCLWPVPVNTLHHDISLVLAGASLHLAMQIGLHVAGAENDFARTLTRSGRSERVRRSRLWSFCCMVCLSTGIQEGIMPLGLSDTCALTIHEGTEDRSSYTTSTVELRFLSRLYEIMVSATIALKQASCCTGKQRDSSIISHISLFDSQFSGLTLQTRTTIDSTYLLCNRTHLLAYYFLVGKASRPLEGFIRLYTVSCDFLNTVYNEDVRQGTDIKPCPEILKRTFLLAAISILKIHRSEIAPHLDLKAGEQAYFGAILASRKMSLESGDLQARTATILSQLWNSQKLFRLPNGEYDSLRSRIRSRLSMSAVFDCLWWWRHEFGGQENPYQDKGQQQNTRRTSPATEEGPEVGGGATQRASEESDFLDDRGVLEGSDSDFLVSDEPFLGLDWATTLNLLNMNENILS